MGRKRTPARAIYAQRLLEYLSNPENPPVGRGKYPEVANYTGTRGSGTYFFKMFKLKDFLEIENKALELRREALALRLMKIDDALLNKAEEGDVPGIKLAYQRFEGWGEKTINETNTTINVLIDADIKALLEPKHMGVIDAEPLGEDRLLPESI